MWLFQHNYLLRVLQKSSIIANISYQYTMKHGKYFLSRFMNCTVRIILVRKFNNEENVAASYCPDGDYKPGNIGTKVSF